MRQLSGTYNCDYKHMSKMFQPCKTKNILD